MSTIPTPNHQFRFLTLPTSQDISKSTKPLSLPDTTNFPFSFTSTKTTQNIIQFTLKNNLSCPNFQHLHYWGCHDLLAALDAYPNATVAYTDGSDDPTVDTPSGAAITFNTTPPTSICNISPIKGSYPAELHAIILFTYLPHINTFSQPIIFAIDNLSVCSTLHAMQQLNAKPSLQTLIASLFGTTIFGIFFTTPTFTKFSPGSQDTLTSLAISILTKFLNGSHSTSLSTQKITTLTLLTSYTTIIHQYQDALHAKLSNTYSQAINTTTYTYLLAPTSTLTHHGFPEYLSNGQTDCTAALVFFPITNSTHITVPNATLITPSTP